MHLNITRARSRHINAVTLYSKPKQWRPNRCTGICPVIDISAIASSDSFQWNYRNAGSMSTGPCRSLSAHSQMNRRTSLCRKSRILFHFVRLWFSFLFALIAFSLSSVLLHWIHVCGMAIRDVAASPTTPFMCSVCEFVCRGVRMHRDRNGIYICLLQRVRRVVSAFGRRLWFLYTPQNKFFRLGKSVNNIQLTIQFITWRQTEEIASHSPHAIVSVFRESRIQQRSILIFLYIALCEQWEASSWIRFYYYFCGKCFSQFFFF